MFWHRSFLLICRQWIYAPEFRIPVHGPEDFSAVLLAMLCRQGDSDGAEHSDAQNEVPASPTPFARDASETGPEVGPAVGIAQVAPAKTLPEDRPTGMGPPDEPLAVAICNGCFRIRRNALEMDTGTSSDGRNGGKEIRSISRALDRMDEFLKERGIEYRDPTGQVYHPGRQDFQSIGEPEEVADLTLATIIRVERPAILVSGKLIQCARGIVGKPAS